MPSALTLMKTGISNSLLQSIFIAVLAFFCNRGQAQHFDSERYERVSLCQFMITYPQKTYFRELEQEYSSIPLPNRMNDHSLGVNFIKFASEDLPAKNRIDHFIKKSNLGRRLIARWFNHSKKKRTFSIDLLRERGYYNATALDARLAKSLLRGESILADNGERLINYTFIAVHDFKPLESELSKRIGFNKKLKRENDDIIQLSDSATHAEYARQFHSSDKKRRQYEIQCITYLYRLRWDDDTAYKFYADYYTETGEISKINSFEADSMNFQIEFVSSISNNIVQKRNRHIKSNEDLVKTAMARIMDLNLSQLQDICPDFRVKASLRIQNGNLFAEIGLKEDVKATDVYEVLERSEDEEGTLHYERIGTVKPMPDKIWDNRFNAMNSEGVDETGLSSTHFIKIDGNDFYDGLIIRKMSTK